MTRAVMVSFSVPLCFSRSPPSSMRSIAELKSEMASSYWLSRRFDSPRW